MKKIFLSGAVLFIVNSAISQNAQKVAAPQSAKPQAELSQKRNKAAQTPEQRAKKKSQKIAQQLGCDPSQTEKIYSLLVSKQKKMNEIRGEKKEFTKEEKEKMREIRKSYVAELKGILNPEQFKKWQESRKMSPERQKVIDSNPNMNDNKKENSDLD
jgi:periplasmic protein CpxP/Spy